MDKEPVIRIEFKTSKDLEGLPDVYLRSFSDAINANSQNYAALETIRKELVYLVMSVEVLQGQIKYGKKEK